MQVEYKKEKALAPIPEAKEKKKGKPVDKKAARMDDSSDDEIGKPQNVGMDSSDEEPPSTKQSVTTAPAQVNMLDDLLGMDMPQTQPTNTGIGGLGDLDFGTTTQAPAQSNDLLGDMMGGMS